ncbi:DEAH (Asp-Glu-Ala-His) box polypeptide 34 [Physocladia obscura]|uniref:DEAH (Asp-Glu-Ala-His) box polypeptide 34 n=1 Tax=Physocladia obscura TaxID=109957 RepID=A0AAD5XI27_9FUNG|nr:DEAH (Asp-Glu-Ala-His) box polypeptide 34 [Physocladia obscura]
MQMPIWGRHGDRVLFGPEGAALFRRHSAEYGDFRDFFAKFKERATAKKDAQQNNANASNDVEAEVSLARQGLKLFVEYQAKRVVAAQQKIAKDRASLPIKAYEAQIVASVRENPVVLIAADTGAGKSTQVPQFLLAAGFTNIACTQPRRIACYSLARRVSFESLNIYGSEIAYQVRFEGTRTAKTKILFLTEGLLLRQFAANPTLSAYNVIIVDEVHERHVTGDFLLGVLKRIVAARPDLRIVLMSATINATLFSTYFDAPVIEVPGRMFPVKVEYLPVAPEEDANLVNERLVNERKKAGIVVSIQAKPGKIRTEPYLRILERIDQLVPAHERGDLLVFLSGMNEITALSDDLRAYASSTRRWIILKLHSSLSVQEQEKVFDVSPPGIRKCILSTNIAETSVTIDGVRFIVDSGRVKETSFDSATRLSRLSEFWISQSSAKQRTGRAGRTGPGECFRFYTQREFDNLNEFPVPEILRTPLEPLLLQTMAYGLGDPREFDFIERPSRDAVESALIALKGLGAVEDVVDAAPDVWNKSNGVFAAQRERLTPLGRILAVFPMDIVLGKMLVLGSISDVVDATIVMAAALTVPNPFVRVAPNRMDIEENRKSLQSDYGDSFTLMNLFSDWLKVKADGRESSKNWCRRYGVEEQRLYEMVKLKTQFEQVLAQYLGREGEEENEDSDDEGTHRYYSGKKRKISNSHGKTEKKQARNESGVETVEDEEEKLRRKMFWKDPAYIKRREQQLLLEQQKRAQSSGRRKFLKFEDGDQDETDIPADEEKEKPEAKQNEIEDFSVHHLEFSLKHNAAALLNKSDTANLTKRDANLLRLVCCSGLYPHIAIADESNAFKPSSEQVYHTKTKRFVKMLPTSVFSFKPELLHPKEMVLPTLIKGSESADLNETLDTIRPKLQITELLCYLELLETNKPYLTNVIRVVAAPNAQKAERIIVLSNWLRTAWDHVMGRRLKNVHPGLSLQREDDITEGTDDDDSELEIMGTSVRTHDRSIAVGSGAGGNGGHSEKHELKEEAGDEREIIKKGLRKRVAGDWSDFGFIPVSVRRIRYDWQMGTTQLRDGTEEDGSTGLVSEGGGDVLASQDFEDLTEYDLSRHLGEFLDIDFQCSVERLRMQDVENWFGYDPFKDESTSFKSSVFTSAAVTAPPTFKGEIRITPHMHYFVSNPTSIKSLTTKQRTRLELVGPRVVSVSHSEYCDKETNVPPPPQFSMHEDDGGSSLGNINVGEYEKTAPGGADPVVVGCAPPEVGNRKLMHCKNCDDEYLVTVVEFLRHRKLCGKK